ncbi:AMP-binding protein [Vibrio splendidus]
MFLYPESTTTVFTEEGPSYSYSELLSLATHLHEHMCEQALVLCQVDSSLGGLVGYLAFAHSCQYVAMLQGVETHEAHIHSLIKKYEPDYVWVPENLREIYTGAQLVLNSYGYSLLKLSVGESALLSDQLCLLASTSGSTGSPKFVRQSRQNILANTASIVEYLGLEADDVAITSLPLNYTYGMSIVNCQIAVGGDIVLTDKAVVQKEFWTQLKDRKVSVLAGVPYTYEMMDRLRAFRKDLPDVKKILQAGGKMSEALQDKIGTYCQEHQKQLFIMYGQTEATTRMSYLPPEHCLQKRGSIGLAIPNGRFKLVDTDGNEINSTEVTGELVFEGYNVCMGYAEQKEHLMLGDEWNGVLYTGDLATKDADGYYFIKGRIKRSIKHFGLRVNLDEVENMLKQKYLAERIAVTDDNEKIIVFTEVAIDEEGLKKYLTEMTEVKRAGIEVFAINSIPSLPNGKIDYQALKIAYTAQ